MLTIRLLRSARLVLLKQQLGPEKTSLTIPPHVLFNALRNDAVVDEAGTSDYRDLKKALDRGHVVAVDGATTISTGAELDAYLNTAGGPGGGGGGGGGDATSIRGVGINAAVGTPAVGQELVVRTGPQWHLTPQPTLTGQIRRWNNATGLWELTTEDAIVTFTRVQTALAAASGPVSVNGQRLTNGAPSAAATDFVIRSELDAAIQSLDIKGSVRVATTANLGALSGLLTIDGVALNDADRVLVKNQAVAQDNGLYEAAAGAWVRARDANTSAEVTSGMYCFVTEGTVNATSGWVLNTPDPIVLGTTPLSFTQFSGAGQVVPGAGLTKTGNQLDVGANPDGSIIVNADNIQVGTLATDGQHGNRGGGALHALATSATAGFISGPDQAALSAMQGELSKSIAAGGTITLTSGEAAAKAIRLTGAAASDTTVEFPATNGREWLVTNESTDNSRSVVIKTVGGSRTIYLGPGRARRVTIVNGELRSDDEKAILIEIDVSLAAAAGNNDTVLCKLPANVRVSRVSVRGVVSVGGGGSSALTVGTAAGGTQIMTSQAAPAAGALLGESSTHWGSDMSANGSAFYSAATTIHFRNAVTGTVNAGSVKITIEAVML
jgi:hypothetical protein